MNAAEEQETSVRAVFTLAWPVMVSMLSYTAMSVVDTLFVARLGTTPLAAVGLAAVLVFFTQSFGAGLMGGVRVLVSQATGAGDHQTSARLGWQGIWIGLPLGVAISLLSLLPPDLFNLLGATPDVAEQADRFFSIRVLGAPLVLLNIGISAWFQGRGDTKTPMRATLLGNAINIALDPLLIFGLWGFPALGVAGAALSTVVAMVFSVFYLALHAAPMLRTVCSSADWRLLRPTLDMGVPIGVRYTLDMGSFVIFSAMITLVGPVELAAHIIVVRICSVSFLPGHAVGEAAGVLVGQFVGSNRPHLARPVISSSIKLAIAIMASWGVVFMLAPDLLVAPFQTEAAVTVVAVNILMVAAAFQVFDALLMAIGGGLNGAGDTRWVMVASLMGAWMVKVPAAYVGAFIFELGAVGAWLGFTLELVLLSIAYVIRLRSKAWLKGAALSFTG
jgi:multidrug resistance protein, MATE family